MPSPKPKTNSSDDSENPSDPEHGLDLDLNLRDWDHAEAGAAPTHDPSLPLLHAAALLPSVLDEVTEGRNARMNPNRFRL